MNKYPALLTRFFNTFADYTLMREISQRITNAELAITTDKHDREILTRIQSSTAKQVSLQTQLYEQFVRYRNDLNRYEPLKTNYMVIAMIDTLINDVLAIDPSLGKAFDIKVDTAFKDSERCNTIISEFRDKIQFDTYISKILFDAIFYGQYWTEYIRDDHKHVVGLKDSYQPGSVFTVGLEGLDCSPLYYKLSTGLNIEIVTLNNENICCLNMQSDRMRFAISEQSITIQSRDAVIAQAGTIGRPFCFEIYDRLINLEMLDQLDISSVITMLQRNSLVSVKAPDGLDLEQIKEFTAYYENMINNTTGNEIGEIYNITQIKMYAAEAAKIRVLPLQTERGAMASALSSSDTYGDTIPKRIDDMRRTILDMKGIPYEFIFTGRDTQPLGASLRKYARYARIIKYMQDGLRRFIVKIVMDLCASYGFNVPKGAIKVYQFCAVNVSEMDRLEYMDAISDVAEKTMERINNVITDPDISKYVDHTAKARFAASLLSAISGASGIINVPRDEKPDIGIKEVEPLNS